MKVEVTVPINGVAFFTSKHVQQQLNRNGIISSFHLSSLSRQSVAYENLDLDVIVLHIFCSRIKTAFFFTFCVSGFSSVCYC